METETEEQRKGRNAARDLIRTAVRTFYGTKHILVIDALMTHSVLHAEDLGILLSSEPKDVRRRYGRLVSFGHILATKLSVAPLGE